VYPDAPIGVIGVDRVHWRCSGFYSRKKKKSDTENNNKVSSFADLISVVIGGAVKMQQIKGYSELPLEKQISLLKDAHLPVTDDLLDKQKEEQKKRKRETLESISIDDLDTFSFKDLQQLAKKNGIKANQKKVDLIAALKTALTSED
jgi:hypothetical protein